jgi:hypothetical protein
MLKRSLASLVILVLIVGGISCLYTYHSHATRVTLQLTRGQLDLYEFQPKKNPPLGIILFASGDGGWSRLEDAICHGLQKHGYLAIGIDSTEYAQTDYDLATLQADFSRIAQNAEAPFHHHPPPLIVGGYSMGAAQTIAVAGGPHPPAGLIGLLLVDPLSRGRYGLRTEDKLDVLPTGPGTFAMADFSGGMRNLRVVQWHASRDLHDSLAWLPALTVPHEEFVFYGSGHTYRHERSRFIRALVNSADWFLTPATTPPAAKMTAGANP